MRLFYAADSFMGLPEPTLEDAINVSQHRHWRKGQHRTSLSAFNSNMRRNGMHDHGLAASRLRVLEGWFHETLPSAPIRQVSFLRLDGDLYASTMDGLNLLYDKVSVGGLIYADDYSACAQMSNPLAAAANKPPAAAARAVAVGCRRAVHEFRDRRNITTPLVKVWQQRMLANGSMIPLFEAVWWQKQAV